MHFDHIAEQRQDKYFKTWLQDLQAKLPEVLAMQLAAQHRPGKPKAACYWRNGAFNICYLVRYEDGFHAIVRFAALGKVMFRAEKVRNEVAAINYLRQNTSVPVPEVFGHGHCRAGPYIVMSFIEGVQLSKILQDPSKPGRPVLNPA